MNIRPKIQERDNYKCQLCGSYIDINIHHIISFNHIIKTIKLLHPELDLSNNEDLVKYYLIARKDPLFTSEKNLITVCKKCHTKIHSRTYRDIMDVKIKKWLNKKFPNIDDSI